MPPPQPPAAAPPHRGRPPAPGAPRHGRLAAGPWAAALWIALPGPPASKSNHRHGEQWSHYAAFEAVVAGAALAARGDDWPLDRDAPLPRRPVPVVWMYARTLVDNANLPKSVCDALEGPVYANDAQISRTVVATRRTGRDQGLAVAVAILPADAEYGAHAAATAELERRVGPHADALARGDAAETPA